MSFGYTAAFAIGVSLLVSFTLTPALSARWLKKHGHEQEATKETFIFRVLAVPYGGMLRWSMRHRWVIVIVAILVSASTVPLFQAIGKDFLPQDDQGYYEVSVRTPPGSSLEGTSSIMVEIEAELRKLPGVKNLLTTVGADVQKRIDRGIVIVQLVDVKERKNSQQQLMEMTRERLRRFKDLTVGVQLPALIQGGSTDRDLMFTLQGPDLANLEKYAVVIKGKLAAVPGVVDLESSYEPGKPELRVDINRDKAADLQVSVASIATALRTLVGGDDQVTTYREGDDRYDVSLRVDKEFRNSPQALERLYVPSSTLGNVALSSVASLRPATGPVLIERYNRQRQILLMASIARGSSLSEALKVLDETVKELNMPPGYTTALVGRSKEFGRAAANFLIAFMLSIIFMYMVLAAQFESFIDPVTILLSLPLSVPFALLSLFLANENFSIIYSSVGILVLFGIVKKNAILQIDHIKSLRAQGMERLEAIMRGCEDRLRPILMTTAALVAGMIPLALGSGAGSGSRRTVGIIVIGGQTLCLLLSLLLTPVAYSLFDDLGQMNWLRRMAGIPLKQKLASLFAIPLILLLAFAPAALAQEAPAKVVEQTVKRVLPVQEALKLAIENNLEIESERVNVEQARNAVKATYAAYDPLITYRPTMDYRTTPVANVLQSPSGQLVDRVFSNGVAATQRMPWNGLTLSAGFDAARASTNNPFSGLNPFYSSRFNVSLMQPLVRNRKLDAPRFELRLRTKQVDVAGAEFERRVIEVITRVQGAYWDVVTTIENAKVDEESVRLAKELVARNKRMIESGTLAAVELAGAEAELARRLDTWYATTGLSVSAENQLKSLLAGSRKSELWSVELQPGDRDRYPAPAIAGLDDAMKTALSKRPELRAIDLRAAANEMEREFAREQKLPQVNLLASWINAGGSGPVNSAPNPLSSLTAASNARLDQLSKLAGLAPLPSSSFGAPPGYLVGGFGTSLSNLFSNNFPSWQVGMSIEWNPKNRAQEATITRTVLTDRQLKSERARIEQLIEVDVRNSWQALRTAQQRIQASETSVKSSQEKLASEERLFNVGESTNFLVLTRQNELTDSRRRLLLARLEWNRAVVRLQQALGITLEANQVRLP